jgi:hypothetical protein
VKLRKTIVCFDGSRGGWLAASALGLALTAGVAGTDAGAVVYFADGFETQTDPLGTPPVGVRWSDNGSGNSYDLITSPVATGTTALRVNRDGGTDVPNLLGVGNAGAFVAGNVVEYSFRVNSITNPTNSVSHNFNGNIQVSVSTPSGLNLASFGTLNGGSENYHASDAGNGNVDLGVTVPRNTAAYDTVRLVLSLTEPAAGQIGGTYEVFVDIDDTDGLTTNSLGTYNLATVTLPVSETTNPGVRLSRGPSSSNVLYDDFSITLVPEPGSMALALAGSVLLIGRRRRSA